jgi:hypothetical protein
MVLLVFWEYVGFASIRHFVVKPHIFQLFDSVLIGYTPIQNLPPGVALQYRVKNVFMTPQLVSSSIILNNPTT